MVRGCASYHHTTGLIPGPGVICAFSLLLVLFLISFLLKNKHSEFQFDLQTEDRNSHLVECQLLNPSCYPIPFIRIKCRLKVKTSRLSMKIYLLVILLLIFFARGLCRKPSPPITTGLPNLFTPLFTFPNFFFSSEEEGEEILRQRGEFPALPFTASDSGSPSPRSPRSPGSISNYSNGGSPLGVPWGDFSATSDFKYPPMPASHKYSSTNGRIKRNRNVPDGFVKSPASGKCLTLFF